MKIKLLLGLAVAGLLTTSAYADATVSAAAKKIFTDNQDSVVSITAVSKISIIAEGANVPEKEMKAEVIGTLVDSSGLVVTVLSQLDPTRSINAQSVRGPKGDMIKLDASVTLKEIKVIMPDGTEIPAEIVLKDADLDLAFIRIKADSKEAKGVTFHAVDLKNSATGSVMDETVTITRMDTLFSRVPNVYPGYINMITKKPRTFLRATGATGGCPTFLTDGKLLGITTTRYTKGKDAQAAILPAADILEIADQAKVAKPSSKE